MRQTKKLVSARQKAIDIKLIRQCPVSKIRHHTTNQNPRVTALKFRLLTYVSRLARRTRAGRLGSSFTPRFSDIPKNY